VACAVCGAVSPTGMKFCGSCGAALTLTGSVATVRKTVTAAFCDVTGSTSLGQRLDPEALRVLMESHFATVSEALVRHGGTVEKFVGDVNIQIPQALLSPRRPSLLDRTPTIGSRRSAEPTRRRPSPVFLNSDHCATRRTAPTGDPIWVA
jgi:hypothetical protein